MKVFLPLLLAALLGVERAHSLVCFTCQNVQSNWYCLKPTICSNTDSYCVTVSASAGLKNVVDLGYSLYKFCSPICGSTSLNFGVASMEHFLRATERPSPRIESSAKSQKKTETV